MEKCNQFDIRAIIQRLQQARLDLMETMPFYAVLLLQMQFSLDPSCETAYTDGTRIAFDPDFILNLSDEELNFVLLHEVLHAALCHTNRYLQDYDVNLWNIACDIVTNSIILEANGDDRRSITLKRFGEAMHLTPDGQEGRDFSAEEVYQMLLSEKDETQKGNEEKKNGENGAKGGDSDSQIIGARTDGGFDDHTYWWLDKEEDGEQKQREEETTWLQRMMDSTTIVQQMANLNGGKGCGNIPSCVERMLKELKEPQTDWREVLDSFIQEEITDYSFNPPDRRFQDSPFLLPDYNEKEDSVKDILFMVDTSGSMSEDQITTCFSEIVGALEQFNGHLKGWLGFFDAAIVEPVPFEDIEELKVIRPQGGGGTRFDIIFQYVEDYMSDQLPASIVILTDGKAPYPEEEIAKGIPVLWIINNEEVTPPWGKVTRIKG